MCTRTRLHLLVVYGCFNVGGNLSVSAGIVAAVSAILPIFAAITTAVAVAGFAVRRRRRIHLHRGCDLLLDGHVAHRNRRRGAWLHAQRVGLPHGSESRPRFWNLLLLLRRRLGRRRRRSRLRVLDVRVRQRLRRLRRSHRVATPTPTIPWHGMHEQRRRQLVQRGRRRAWLGVRNVRLQHRLRRLWSRPHRVLAQQLNQ